MTEGRKVQRLLWVTPPLSETESERESLRSSREGAAADSIFRICSDPVRMFPVWFLGLLLDRSDQTISEINSKIIRNRPLFILNFQPLWTHFEEETAISISRKTL